MYKIQSVHGRRGTTVIWVKRVRAWVESPLEFLYMCIDLYVKWAGFVCVCVQPSRR